VGNAQPDGMIDRSKPETLRGRELSVSLTVKNLERSIAWYRDVVGFVLQQQFEYEGRLRAARMIAGDIRILLNQDDGAKGWDRVKGEGFSMSITTAQDIDEIAKRITDAGGTLESQPADMPWGVRMFRLHDPDGYRLAISSERKQTS